jgi:hypothetical protein
MPRVESITVAPTAERKSTPGRFEASLDGAARTLSAGLAGAVELAAPAVPFGTLLSGAVRGATGGGAGRAASASSLTVPATGTGTGTGTGATGGTGGETDLIAATRALQQEAQAMNLQYLQLPERMQQESREYTALSNVMKVKHETARSAIGNIH